MRKEIIKRIIVWVTTVVLLLAGGVTVGTIISNLPEEEEPNISYALNTENFEGLITYGEEIDLSLITITKTENGVSTDIPVDLSMVTTHVDTTRVGASVLELRYEGQEFSVPVTVKYKIQFKVDGEVVDTIHALTSSELDEITPPQKEGYTFSGWSKEIPDVLYENMVLTAIYQADIPALRPIDATYGDNLADITLLSTPAGAWRFDDAEGTVGNAGKRTFDVSFIENGTNAVLKTGKLTINVAKREVKIDVFADFTYNGTRQYPTYKTDVDVDVVSWPDGDKNYTDVGEYSYHFEIDDPNYTGEAKGTYVIKKAVVTVKINSYNIKANEAFPKAEYEISGFEGMGKEELAEFIGLSIIYPDAVVIGVHTITAKASNPSIQLEVEEGTITVEQAAFDGIGDPNPVTKVATYGDLLGSIEFASHPNGKWVWETPEVKVGDVGKHTYAVIFVPSSSAFKEVKAEVEITVIPKPMKVEIVGNTIFDYDGEEHDVDFVVTDLDGTVCEDLIVLGNASYKDAGSYTVTLSFENENYAIFVDENNSSKTKVVSLTIKKIDPVTDFTQVFPVVWSAALKLSDIELPEGYTWDDPEKRLDKVGIASYAVTFTPSDITNYNVKTGEIKVDVKKATATINGVEKTYERIYDGNPFTITGVTASNGGELVYTFEDGTPFNGVTDAGTYSVIITLPESETYNKAEVITTITISPATNRDIVQSSQSAEYGTLALEAIKLPETTTGTWSIVGVTETTTVGDVGNREFTLLFTPETGNYYERTANITVTVSQKRITPPKIQAPYDVQAYTGEALFSGLKNGEGYEVIEVTNPVNVGTYTVILRLVSDNYSWNDFSTADKYVTYEIVRANNSWVKEPQVSNWEYGAQGIAATATPFTGTLKIEYKLKSAADSTYSTELPAQSGTYVARFTVTDDNYNTLSETHEFTISKKKISIQYTQQYTYTGKTIKADIDENDALYTISDGGHTAASDTAYFATLTLTNEAAKNYEWADAVGSRILQLPYYINKADVGLSNLQISDYAFGGMPAPSVDMVFNITPTYLYYKDADCTEAITITASTPAGTYYVKAEFAGTTNLLASSIGPEPFQITQTGASISGVINGSSVSKGYLAAGYSFNDLFPNLKASHNETALVYKVDGEVVNATTFKFVNVKANDSAYTVVITLPASHNYEEVFVTVTVKITPVANNDTFKSSYNVIYGDLITELEELLPDSDFGTWTIDTQETTVGDAGTGKTFTAKFTPYEQYQGNYATRTQPITVNVAKASVTIVDKNETILPATSTDGRDYNGGAFALPEEVKTSNGVALIPVITKKGEEVSEIKGVGTYIVTYTYAGDDNHEATLATITVKIDPATIEFEDDLTVEKPAWTFAPGAVIPMPSVTVKQTFVATEEIYFEYQYSADGVTWTDWTRWAEATAPTTWSLRTTASAPAQAGYYRVRAVVDATADYGELTTPENEIVTFVINKAEVIVPTYTTQYPYKGVPIEVDIADTADYDIEYTPATNVANNLSVILKLADPTNYKWVKEEGVDGNYGHSNNITLYYDIVKANVNVSVGTVEWTYSEAIEIPVVTITKDFTNPEVVSYDLYYSTDNGTTWKIWNDEEISKLSATTYKVRAIVKGDTNYNGKTVDGIFKVNPKQDSITGINLDKSYTTNYTGSAYTFAGLGAERNTKPEFSYAYKQDGGEWIDGTPTNHGTYTVKITLKDSTNYKGISEEVTLVINKAPNTDTITVDKDKAIYGNLVLDAIKLPTNNIHGSWSIEGVGADTTFASAGNNQFFVAVFTPHPAYADNYEGDRRELSINVKQASVTITDKDGNALPSTGGRPYNGGEFILPDGVKTSNGVNLDPVIEKLNAQGDYAPHTGAIVNVGTYKVTYSYTDANNNFANATATITVTITTATVTVPTPSITGWEYGMSANEPSLEDFTFKSELSVTYKYYSNEGCTDEVEDIATAGADTYWVKAIVTTTNTNLVIDAANAKKSFQIQKAPIYITNPDGTALTKEHSWQYTGSAFNPLDIVKISNGSCTFTVNGFANMEIKNYGEYTIVYTVEETDNYLGKTETVTVTIEKANVTLNSIEITPWIYKQYNAEQNKARVALADGYEQHRTGAITFKYYTNAACTEEYEIDLTKTSLNNLGVATYYVRAFFAGDNNLNPTETAVEDAVAFTLARAPITLNVAGDATISKEYNKNQTVTVPGVTAWNNKNQQVNGLDITILVNGEDHNNVVIKNQGTYIITYSFVGNTNYAPTTETETVTVNIAKVTNTEFVNQSQSAVYGESVLAKVTLPTGVEGTWYLATYDSTTEAYVPVAEGTTFQSATTHTFYAVYVPDENGNYEREPVQIIVAVGQLGIPTPTVNNITYDGKPHNSGIQDREGYDDFDYFVVEGSDQGGSDHNDYTVILELKRPDVHKWTLVGNAQLVDGNAARVIITYSISEAAQNWKDGKHPTIDREWQYQKPTANAYGYAEAEHGGVAYYYTDYNNGEYTFTLSEAEKTRPIYPGEYVVRIITTDTNYDIKYQDLTFTITPREIPIPGWTEPHYSYTGDFNNPYNSGLSSLIEDEYTIYTIIEDVRDRVNVGDYSATATLNNPEGKIYYVWDDGNPEKISTDVDAQTFTYHIDPNKIVISGLSINGWGYTPNNANAQAPSYDLKLEIENNYINLTDADKLKVDFRVRYYDSQTDELIVDAEGEPTVPTQAGTYYVTVQVTPKEGYNNLTASDVAISSDFTITQAAITELEGIGESYGRPYNDEPFDKTAFETAICEANPGLGLNFAYYLNGELYTGVIEDARTYNVVITLDAATDNNYNLTTNGETKIVIEQITVDLTGVTFAPVTYGQSIDKILSQIPANKREFGEWTLEEATLGDVGENKSFTAIFTSTNTNYKNNRVTITVSVKKAPLAFTTPTASELTAQYTNGKFTTPAVTALNSKTNKPAGLNPVITITAITGDTTEWSVGTYTVLYEFNKDNTNSNYESGSTTITFTVTPAQITFTGAPSIANGGWTYHPQNANLTAPSNTVVQTYAQGAVYFEYSFYDVNTKTWGEWTRWDVTAPKDAGDYKVRAVVPTDPADPISNYTGATSAEGSFKIDKAPTSITVNGTNIDKTYDGDVVPVPDGTVSNGVVLTPVLEKQNAAGEYNSYNGEIKNVGTYRITYSYAGDSNYFAAETQTITITISTAEIKFKDDLAIRGENDIIVRVWNYNGQSASMPTVSFIEEEEGKQYYSEVGASEVYFEYQYSKDGITWPETWTPWEDAEASDVATFALRSSGNAPKDAGFYKVRARVHGTDVNKNAVNYEKPEEVISGEFTFEIKKAPISITKPDGNALPETDTRPYNGNEYDIPAYEASFGVAVDVTVTFNGVVYEEDEFSTWTVWNFGTYTITYAFVDTTGNYEDATETIVVTITQAEVTISKPVINDDGWKYGMAAREPDAVTFDQTFAQPYNGGIEFKYYSDKECTIEISKPDASTPHGTYYVRAEFDKGLTHNIKATESEATEFTIAKADTVINVGTITTNKDYDNVAVTLPTVTTHGVTLEPDVKKWNEATQEFDIPVGKNDIKAVGTYLVTYYYDGTNTNYVSQTATVEITIDQANIEFKGISIEGWTYDDYKGSEPSVSVDEKFEFALDLVQYQYAYWYAETNAWGEWIDWTDETDPASFNAGKYRIKAILTNDGTGNYTGDEITDEEAFEFEIEKADATIEGVRGDKTYSNPYRGKAYTVADLFASVIGKRGNETVDYTKLTYKVGETTFTGITDFGTVTVVITLPESNNYKAATETVTVSVTTATVELADPAISWMYGAFNNAQPTVTIKLNEVDVTDPDLIPVAFSYYKDRDCTDPIIRSNTTPAGVYYIKAEVIAASNGNYSAAGPVVVAFTVAKSNTASITGVTGGTDEKNPLELPYIEGGYSINDLFGVDAVKGSHTETMLEFKVGDVTTKDPTHKFFTDGVIKNGNEIGVYELIITLPTSNTCNYEATSLTVYVRIMPATNTDTFEDTSFEATFGDNIWDVLEENSVDLPKGWTIQNATTDTKVGDVGTRTFYLVFDNGNNYYERQPVPITIEVKPAEAEVLRDGKEIGEENNSYTAPYQGSAYNVSDIIKDIAETHGLKLKYTLKDATAIEDIGKYTVEITLDPTAPNYGNYALASAIEVTIEITKAGVIFGDIDIGNWEYHPQNSNKQTPGVETTPVVDEGDLYFEYIYSVDGNVWSETWAKWTDKAPAAVGYYRVRAVVEESDAYASTISGATGFEITIARVNKPDFEVDEDGFIKETDLKLFYNGEVQTPAISLNDYYTIEWSDYDAEGNPTSTNFGEYWVKLSLIDKTNSKWNTTDTDDVTYKYRINKAPVTITAGSDITKDYDGNEVTPAATASNGATVSILVNGKDPKDVVIKNAGTYTITYSVAESGNYLAATATVTVTINKATPTITKNPNFVGGRFYQSLFKPEATGAETSTSGTWTWNTISFADGENASTVAYTFTPADTTNYTTLRGTFNVTFVTVAYLGDPTASTSTPYGTIENALDAATSGDVVWVRPYDKTINKPIPITRNVTIKSGVTLLLPYGADGKDRNKFDTDGITYDLNGNIAPTDGKNDYCHVQVVVDKYVVITNYGTLEIAGQLSSGNGGAAYSGNTAGQHAKLSLDSYAKIDNYGTILAAGFIREAENSTGSEVIVNSSSILWQPYVVRDFQGGSFSYAVQDVMNEHHITAFNRFILMNVSPLLTLHKGGELKVWAGLYASKQHNRTTVTLIGGSNSVIELTHANGYLTAKYNVANEICELHIYGGATTHPMVLTVLNIPISTENCFFALSYHYNVTLHKLDEQTEATYTMGQRFKLMPGAAFTVDMGAKVIVNTFVVYTEATPNADGTYSSTDEVYNGFLTGKGTDGSTVPVAYPTNAQLQELGIAEERSKTGILTVNGQMVCDVLAGKVYSEVTGASIIVNTARTYRAVEPKVHSGESFFTRFQSYNKFDVTAELINDGDGTVVTPELSTTYAYANGVWKQPIVRIEFNANGGNGVGSIGVPFEDGIYQGLPTPTRDHYYFVGWKDADGNPITNGTALPTGYAAGDIFTLTAEWELTTYYIDYEFVDGSGNQIQDVEYSASYNTFTYDPDPNSTLSWPNLTLSDESYTLKDWKFNNKIVQTPNLGDWLAAAKENDGRITLVVVLTKESTYNYVFDFNNTQTGYNIDSVTLKNQLVGFDPNNEDYADLLLNKVIYAADGTEYQTSTAYQFYFEGWYTEDGVKYDPATYTPDENATEIKLYAKWITKFTVVFKYNDVVKGKYYLTKDDATTTPKDDMTGFENGTSGGHYITFNNWSNSTYGAVNANVTYKVPEAATDATVEIVYSASVTKSAYVYNAVVVDVDDNIPLTVTNGSWKNADGTNKTDLSTWSDGTYYLLADPAVTISVKASNSGNWKAKLGLNNATPTTTLTQTKAATELTAIKTTSTYECLIEGTLITLADGTQKKIEDLEYGDQLLVFNHETGRMEAGILIMLDHTDVPRDWYNVINLVFSNDEVLRIHNVHGLFDITLNKYVFITEENFHEFVGHEFYAADYNGSEFVGETVTLTEAYITCEYVRIYSPVTAVHLNHFASGMLAMAPAPDNFTEGHTNVFEFDENLKYDEEKMQADIEKYGLYTYDDFAEYLTEDQFNALSFAYLKVAVGKGNLDWEGVMKIVEFVKVNS